MAGPNLQTSRGCLLILFLLYFISFVSSNESETNDNTRRGDNQRKMKRFDFDLFSVRKKADPITNKTELTVRLMAPDGAYFYWFDTNGYYAPALERGTISSLIKRGDITEIKLKSLQNDQYVILIGRSNITNFHVFINMGGDETEVSVPLQNCQYSTVDFYETDTTYNNDITLECDTALTNHGYEIEAGSMIRTVKKDGNAMINTLRANKRDFNVSLTSQGGGSIVVSSTVSKQTLGQYYAWSDHGISIMKKQASLVESINFIADAEKSINGKDPVLPQGRAGLGYTKTFDVLEGTECYIPCYSFGNPTPTLGIAKIYDGKLILQPLYHEDKTLTGHSTAWIKFQNVSLANGGEYSCVASIDGNIFSDNFTVVVYPKDFRINVGEKSIQKTTNGAVNVTFEATGYADIKATCFKDNTDSLLTDESRDANVTTTVADIGGKKSRLTYTILLDPVLAVNGSGYLICEVSNDFDYHSFSFDLYTFLVW